MHWRRCRTVLLQHYRHSYPDNSAAPAVAAPSAPVDDGHVAANSAEAAKRVAAIATAAAAAVAAAATAAAAAACPGAVSAQMMGKETAMPPAA